MRISSSRFVIISFGLAVAGITAFSLVSCSSTAPTSVHRLPASSADGGQGGLPPDFQDGMVAGAQKILERVSASSFDSTTCVADLQNIESEISALSPTQEPQQIQDEIASHAKELIQGLWNIRLALHQRLPEFNAACSAEIRNASRLLRFAEDFLAEQQARIAHTQQDLDPDKLDFFSQPTPVTSDEPYYLTLTNPAFGKFQFKDGDIMLARGPSFLSALISRIGDVSSQFSHVVFVHVDKTTGKVNSIESYVGPGAATYDIDYALRNENVRLLLLRAKDPELAAKAADYVNGKVNDAIAAGHPIPYDYTFSNKDHTALTCAAVSEWGFEEASSGQVILPMYPGIVSASPTFLKRLSMSDGPTFMPGDLENDPRFDMVMEWRDLRLTRDSRTKDSIMTSMLQWIDQKGYVLRDTFTSTIAGDIVWPIRRTFLWPLLKKVLSIPDFSESIPKNMFQASELLNQLGEVMLNHTKAVDSAFEQKTGWPMTYQDLYGALEDYRAQDLAYFKHSKTRKKAEFSFAFRPVPKKAPPPKRASMAPVIPKGN